MVWPNARLSALSKSIFTDTNTYIIIACSLMLFGSWQLYQSLLLPQSQQNSLRFFSLPSDDGVLLRPTELSIQYNPNELDVLSFKLVPEDGCLEPSGAMIGIDLKPIIQPMIKGAKSYWASGDQNEFLYIRSDNCSVVHFRAGSDFFIERFGLVELRISVSANSIEGFALKSIRFLGIRLLDDPTLTDLRAQETKTTNLTDGSRQISWTGDSTEIFFRGYNPNNAISSANRQFFFGIYVGLISSLLASALYSLIMKRKSVSSHGRGF